MAKLVIKGLEKTAFLKPAKGKEVKKEKGEEQKKIQIITKVQQYIDLCLGKLEKVFVESLGSLRRVQKKERELKEKLKDAVSQNQFWEMTNEKIENQLNQVDGEKIEMQKKIKLLEAENSKLKKNETTHSMAILNTEKTLMFKNSVINKMRSFIKKSDQHVKQIENAKEVVEEMQKETLGVLEETEERNQKEQRSAEKEIQFLEQKNFGLNSSLQTERDKRENLMKELQELRRQLENKNNLIKALSNQNGIEGLLEKEEYNDGIPFIIDHNLRKNNQDHRANFVDLKILEPINESSASMFGVIGMMPKLKQEIDLNESENIKNKCKFG